MSDNSSSVEIGRGAKGTIGHEIKDNTIYNADKIDIYQNSIPEAEKEKPLKDGNPYIGLKKFTAEDKDKFFGREKFTEELCQHLLGDKKNVLLLLGTSGSGKSSLIQAGLIPGLREIRDPFNPFKSLTFAPNDNPFKYVRDRLASAYEDDREKREIPQSITAETWVQVMKSLKDRWLIFIDQFEQIFTRTLDTKIRESFIKSLLELIEAYEQDQTLKIVIAMRIDFLDEFTPYAGLVRLHDRYSKMMRDMSDQELRAAIERPATEHGVKFEENSEGKLVDQIIKDFRKQSVSLPLLQYTLELLWEKDNVEDRVLNWETYHKIGKVEGALNQHANAVYNTLEDANKEAVKQILLKVVTLNRLDKQKPVSQRAVKAEFDETQTEVLEKLLREGLLRTNEGRGEATTVEVAHEALLESWQVVTDLITKEEEFIIIKAELEDDAYQWHEQRKKDGQGAKEYLLGGWRLDRAIKLDKSKFDSLEPNVRKFVEASQQWREEQRRREKEQEEQKLLVIQQELDRRKEALRQARIRTIGVGVAGFLMTGLALFLGSQLRLSKVRQIQALVSSSEANLASGAELDAMMDGLRANKTLQQSILLSVVPSSGLREQVLNRLSTILNTAQEYNRLDHSDDVNSVAFSPDGQTIASASWDNTMTLWNLEGKKLQTFQHGDDVDKVAFSPDGKIIASASKDNAAKLWNLEGKLLQTLQHAGAVNSVVFSPNGQTIASASNDSMVRLWNLQGEELHALPHESAVFGMTFSPNGEVVASASKDKTVKLWNLEGKLLQTLPHDDFAYSVAFSPDEQVVASASKDKTVRLWNLEGKLLHTLQHSDQVGSVAFSPDGQVIASASFDNTVKLWNLEGKLLQILPHSENVTQVVFNPNGKIVASASDNNTVTLWNLEGKELQTLHHDGNVSKIAFSKDGQLLASASKDNTLKLWNLKDNALHTFQHSDGVTTVEFSKDGQTIVSASKDNTIRLWNLNSKKLHSSLQHLNAINDVVFSPNGQTIASASEDDTVKLANLNGEELHILWHGDAARSVVFSPDGQTIASASQDNTVKLWSLNGQKLHTLPHDDLVHKVVFSPDGQTIASASLDGIVKLWNLKGQELHTFKHNTPVFSVAFSPDGQMIASGDKSGTMKLWNSKGKLLHMLLHSDEIKSIEFSPDGRTVASASFDNTARLWNLKGKLLQTLRHNDAVTSVIFSPNGETVASASFDNTARLWNLKGKLLQTFPHNDVVSRVRFSPDGQTLASASFDGTVKLWKVENFDQVFDRACAWVQGYLANNSSVKKSDTHLCD